MNYTPQQGQALQAIQDWLTSDRQVFKLFGYAGTGKTTLAREVEQMATTVLYTAFTGKAVMVLRDKGCLPAETCHAWCYRASLNEFTNVWSYSLNNDSLLRSADVVVLDEASMITQDIAQDLLKLSKKVLVLADPAQLPPVGDSVGYFMQDPDFVLTEIHRQAADNPIIALSMDIRNGKPVNYGKYGDKVRILRNRELTDEVIGEADQIIVGSNQTRHYYNNKARNLLGLPKYIPRSRTA